MDLRQLARAVAAHRGVAALGVLLAFVFAFLAQVRVDPFGDPALKYRRSVVWGSTVTLQITQKGFPEGQATGEGAGLSELAPLYATMATTDPVRRRMKRLGPVIGGARAEPLTVGNSSFLPLFRITGFAFSAPNARLRAQRQAEALIGYVTAEQRASNVRPRNQLLLKIVKGPSRPQIVVGRKPTLAVVVFLSMLVLTGALVLVLENLRRGRQLRAPSEDGRPSLEAIKSPAQGTDGHDVAEPQAMPVNPAARKHAAGGQAPKRTLHLEPEEGLRRRASRHRPRS